ncbi:MAG: hypothetical protein M3O28_08260 [Actinomycetota bacterium]|nr:hypothetical protein [Actinomycetota bacterium]
MPRPVVRRAVQILVAGGLVTASAVGFAVSAGARTPFTDAPGSTLTAHTILRAASHGWTSPDDLTNVGDSLFVSFQNGVPSTGGTVGTPTTSTIVKLGLDGTIEHTWKLTGKCDGLTADPANGRVVATVNEDGNSSLYTIPAYGNSAATHYVYDANPLPHGGGTDNITIYRGDTYVIASAPASGGPALYRVTLDAGIAHLAAAPFYDTSTATVANAGANNATVNLALTDPDSSTVVPDVSPRFARDFMLDAQGDQQAIFASHLGAANQRLQVLNLSQSVDDTAFATRRRGILVATDSKADSVVVIAGAFTPGGAYTSVTPGNANSAPPNPTPNYLGQINLSTGSVSAVSVAGATLTPHSLIYIRKP